MYIISNFIICRWKWPLFDGTAVSPSIDGSFSNLIASHATVVVVVADMGKPSINNIMTAADSSCFVLLVNRTCSG